MDYKPVLCISGRREVGLVLCVRLLCVFEGHRDRAFLVTADEHVMSVPTRKRGRRKRPT
jgi:hypothetical protein